MKEHMLEYYYYLRTPTKMPIVTVCLLKVYDDKYNLLLARGVAICSIKDNPVKEVGRKLAHKRAMKALKSSCSWYAIGGKSEIKSLNRLEKPLFNIVTKMMKVKSSFSPMTTIDENNLLKD